MNIPIDLPWMAALLVIGIIAFGYWELRTTKSRIPGITTWIFAAPPFLAILYWIISWDALPFVVRGVVVGGLTLGAWKGVSMLFRKAIKGSKGPGAN